MAGAGVGGGGSTRGGGGRAEGGGRGPREQRARECPAGKCGSELTSSVS